MTKVKVSKEVAEFIKAYEDEDSANWKDYIMVQHSQAWSKDYEEVTIKDRAKCLKDISPMQLADMLTNGYEVEKTPEDELFGFYLQIKVSDGEPFDPNTSYRNGLKNGIEIALQKLNIQIKGINEEVDE